MNALGDRRSSALLLRGLRIAAIVALHGTALLAESVATALFRGTDGARVRCYRGLVDIIERLGPTFIKFGQILSCRRDVLPDKFCEALGTLHAEVRPMTESETRQALAHAYTSGSDVPFAYEDLTLLASGSIASVFRARARTGTVLALKLRRPAIEQVMRDDLALLEAISRLMEHLPKCKGMPIGDLVRYLSTAILGQLDFEREGWNLARIHKSLSSMKGIRVPMPLKDFCGPGCLAMEFIPGLDTGTLDTLSIPQRADLAEKALLAVRQLMFVDGFTHCDLHPGNLYATATGDLVILDAGFAITLPEKVRALIGEFFFCLFARRGRRCGEIILESAAAIRPRTDVAGFINAVAALVESQTHGSVFSMMAFGNQIFELQQSYGLYAESDFAFPMMSLAVLEGTVRRLDPQACFEEVGRVAVQTPRVATV